jgi:hypothetical protein
MICGILLRMQLESAFLATDVTVERGTISTIGAFPEWWTVGQTLPSSERLMVAVVVSMAPDEAEAEFMLHAVVREVDNGAVLGEATIRTSRGAPPRFTDGTPLYQFVLFEIGAILQHPGPHSVEILTEDTLLKTIAFGVRGSTT